jgi:hypothetical protein
MKKIVNTILFYVYCFALLNGKVNDGIFNI